MWHIGHKIKTDLCGEVLKILNFNEEKQNQCIHIGIKLKHFYRIKDEDKMNASIFVSNYRVSVESMNNEWEVPNYGNQIIFIWH